MRRKRHRGKRDVAAVAHATKLGIGRDHALVSVAVRPAIVGAVAHQSWTVVLTLATGELVTTTSGANSAPTPPNAFTFTASGPIPAHGTQSFTITVTGLKTPPTGCTIDGHPCS